ncbi:hypothetical protein DFJ74DRAFT_665307 [Hyaloraphidium curvatum]|nr:hypothetical protein DFJ74DRAFT_665307 [Hyaloraphidium curvatum]
MPLQMALDLPLGIVMLQLLALSDRTVRSREGLATFFPKGRVPAEPMEVEQYCALCLELLPSLYPVIRRIAMPFADAAIRERWGAYEPSGAGLGSPLPAAMAKATETFDAAFKRQVLPVWTILQRLTKARPVRHRLADDVLLLDAAARTVLADDWKDLLHAKQPSLDTPAKRTRFVGIPIPQLVLQMVVLENAGPWLAHAAEVRERGGTPAADSLDQALDFILAAHAHVPDPAFAAEMRGKREVTDMIVGKAAIDPAKTNTRTFGNVPDTCDGCGKRAALGTLSRCSRCFVARYCGAACQKEAWIEGHKAACRDARPNYG